VQVDVLANVSSRLAHLELVGLAVQLAARRIRYTCRRCAWRRARARVDIHTRGIAPEDRKRGALIGCPEPVGADCVTSDPTPVGRAHVSNPEEVITLPPAFDNRRYRAAWLMRQGCARVHEHALPTTNTHWDILEWLDEL